MEIINDLELESEMLQDISILEEASFVIKQTKGFAVIRKTLKDNKIIFFGIPEFEIISTLEIPDILLVRNKTCTNLFRIANCQKVQKVEMM
jgi:hypothetical protein